MHEHQLLAAITSKPTLAKFFLGFRWRLGVVCACWHAYAWEMLSGISPAEIVSLSIYVTIQYVKLFTGDLPT